jgi:hypothetical protein
MSAEVSDGSVLLVAPGKRYWYRTADYLTGCDGGRPWELSEDDDDENDGSNSVHWVSDPEPPLPRLLCPASLLKGSRLEVRGRTQFRGREALDAVVRSRPSLAAGPTASEQPVEIVVDEETGVLLRIAEPGGGAEPEVTELVRVDFAPVIDPSRFESPTGSLIAESFAESLGPALKVGATAVGLAAGALGTWIRYSPFRRGPTAPADAADADRLIARDEAPPDLVSDEPVSDELLALLYAGGPTELAATLHTWVDVAALAASVPASARRAGLGGLGLLMDVVGDHPATRHTVSAICLAGPGRYQIDHAYQPRRRPVTIACDGQRTWQVYPDKVTAGPAKPPPDEVGSLADPSWLLQSTLSGGARVTCGGRSAYRITVTRRPGDGFLLFRAAVAVIDAELGIVLRLTYYIGDKPVRRYELRDVRAAVGDFQVRIPDNLPMTEAPSPRWTSSGGPG